MQYGYAVSQAKDSLLTCGTAKLRRFDAQKYLGGIQEIIAFYKPQTIVIRDPDTSFAKCSERVRSLIEEIEILACGKRIAVHRIPRAEINRAFKVEDGKMNKHKVAEQIGERFPAYQRLQPKRRRFFDSPDYHTTTYDAIALLLTYYHFHSPSNDSIQSH